MSDDDEDVLVFDDGVIENRGGAQDTSGIDSFGLGSVHPALRLSPIHPPRLYNPLYKDGLPHYWEIGQAALSDCYFLSTIGAVAYVHPEKIKESITISSKNPLVYSVQLFRDEHKHLTQQLVSKSELISHLYFAQYNKIRGNGGAFWPCILEAAYAKYCGHDNITEGDKQIAHPGSSRKMMQVITGNPPTVISTDQTLHYLQSQPFADIKTPTHIINDIYHCIHDLSTPVTLSFIGDGHAVTTSEGNHLYSSHAYMVINADTEKENITVRNPYGWTDKTHESQNDFTVPIQLLADNRSYFCLGNW